MSTYQTTGFILSSRDFRESDKIFSIHTSTHGKIEALATGVRKIKSKLRAHLEPFSVIDLMIAHGRRHDRLIGAIQQKNYKKIKSNYKLSIINYQFLEIIDQLTKIHHPDPRIFNLLKEVFDFYTEKMINDKCQMDKYYDKYYHPQPKYQISVFPYFAIRLLSYLGYTPELKICIRCKNPVSNPTYFSYHDGSIICERCHAYRQAAVIADQSVSPESIKILQNYLFQNLEDCCHLGNDESYKITQGFLNYHLDRPLKSLFISE